MKFREITYMRLELHHDPEERKGNLLWLVFDIPYFDACGIFPPFHIVNQIFLSGCCGGGMSPGTSCEPFSISEEEHAALVDAVFSTPRSEIAPHARYAWFPRQIDHSFDHIQDYVEWLTAVCEKHRDSFHQKLLELRKTE